jgi:hypothetical protein
MNSEAGGEGIETAAALCAMRAAFWSGRKTWIEDGEVAVAAERKALRPS